MILSRAMTALSLLTVLAAVLAVALWRSWFTRAQWPFYRPVAALLLLIPISDTAQWAIRRRILDGRPMPYIGADAAWFHLQAALFLGQRFAILATGLAVFLSLAAHPRLAPWLAMAAWAAASIAFAMLYPGLRQEPRWIAHGAISILCAAAVLGLGRWYRSRGAYHAAHISTLIVAVGELGAAVAYLRGNPERDWTVARLAHGLAFVALLWYQGSQIWRYRR